MGRRRYIDFELIEQFPNKYNLTPNSIKELVIKDWDKLKTKTWKNDAMKKTGTWWCRLIGCNDRRKGKSKFDDEDEFWIGFREEDNKINCYFTSFGGMCGYEFDEFYKAKDIENDYDMNVQVNTIAWLNELLDEGILEQST